MIKKILIINSHPDKDSYNFALSDKYIKGAEESGAKVKSIDLYSLEFKAFFRGIEHGTVVEPDIENSQALLKWADHIVFFFP